MLKPYRCGHCKKRIVILPTETNSVLPVEIPEGQITLEDEMFNSAKHTSHLLNCAGLQKEWKEKKMRFIERQNPFEFLSPKELAR